ncbi:hypothetical protein PIB30_091855, partial [Stylosanthes scabra]|nr:hypothetical protein [Stylosanthes scabra]
RQGTKSKEPVRMAEDGDRGLRRDGTAVTATRWDAAPSRGSVGGSQTSEGGGGWCYRENEREARREEGRGSSCGSVEA